MASTAWRDGALCASEGFKKTAKLAGTVRDSSEVFFPVTEDDDGKQFLTGKQRENKYVLREARFERLARATCASCPVRVECLLETMELESHPYGISGGLDAENRMALLDDDNPKLHKRECKCGTIMYGVKGKIPEKCSAICKGDKSEEA